MNGPEHYREAERLLDDKPTVRDWRDDPESSEEHWRLTVSEAQVHATLALAAITAYPAVKDYHGDEGDDAREWTKATS